MSREESLQISKQKIKRAANKDEVSQAMISHMKKYWESSKVVKKPSEVDQFIDYLSKPLADTVEAPIFQ